MLVPSAPTDTQIMVRHHLQIHGRHAMHKLRDGPWQGLHGIRQLDHLRPGRLWTQLCPGNVSECSLHMQCVHMRPEVR